MAYSTLTIASRSQTQGRAEGGFQGFQETPLNFLPMKIGKNRNTLIEHSNNLLKQSRALIVPCHL